LKNKKMQSTPGFGWASPGIFQVGRGKTLAIPMSLHEVSREKVVQIMRSRGHVGGIMLLRGGEEQNQYDTDTELLFRQDSWFNYLFGVKEAGVFGAVCLSTGRSTLFIPRLPQEYRIWCGEIHTPDVFQVSYAVDEVLFVENLSSWITARLVDEQVAVDAAGATTSMNEAKLYLLHGVNSDSGLSAKPATFEGLEENAYLSGKLDSDPANFFHALSTARVTKSEREIDVMRYCAWVASNAHVEVMRTTKADMLEYELEAKFLYEIYKNGGCRKCAYTSICACGPNGATLHYGHAGAPNDRTLLETDMALLDMGAEYHGYVSDITCSFPVSGTFSPDQRAIYTAVLNAQRAVLDAMRPGVAWPDCHRLAEAEIVKALLELGILVNGSVEELCEAGMGAIFFPHGLGHLIGCDTHDVGGYIEGTPSRVPRPGLQKLRTARILESGMTLTNEPGCYFINALLEDALQNPAKAKFLDETNLTRFRSFGGVRLEDVVLVTNDGVVNLTTCPRTIEEVEGVLAGGPWPPAVDDAPYLRRQWCRLEQGGKRMVLV